MNLSRPGVVSTYARQSVSTAFPLSAKPAFALEVPGALAGVPAADLGAMVVESAYGMLRERVGTRRGMMGPGRTAGDALQKFADGQRVTRVCTLMHSLRRVALASRRATASAANAASPALRVHWTARRCLHVRRALPYAVEDGLAPLFSPEALQTLAVDYQQGLLDRLNEETRGKHITEISHTRIC